MSTQPQEVGTIRLEQLQYCLEAANCRTISKAAKRLYITQSSLSTAIQNLEDEVGFQIFKRSPHGVTVTDKGQLLLERAKIIDQQLQMIKELGSDDEACIRNITMTAVPSVCNTITTELIRKMKDRKESVNFNVVELRPDKIMDSLINGSSDIAIGGYSESNKGKLLSTAARCGLRVDTIYEDKMYAFVSRNHRLANEDCVYMEEFVGEVPALFSDRAFMAMDEEGLSNYEAPKNVYTFTDQSSIKQIVANNLAYAVLPYSMAYNDIYVNTGLIRVLPIKDVDASISVYAAYDEGQILSEEKAFVVETMREIYAEVDKEIAKIKNNKRTGENNRIIVY